MWYSCFNPWNRYLSCSAYAKDGFFLGDGAQNDMHVRIERKASLSTHGDRWNGQYGSWGSKMGILLRMLHPKFGLGTHHRDMEQESAPGDPFRAYYKRVIVPEPERTTETATLSTARNIGSVVRSFGQL